MKSLIVGIVHADPSYLFVEQSRPSSFLIVLVPITDVAAEVFRPAEADLEAAATVGCRTKEAESRAAEARIVESK